jgi:Uma2 family endonuclease
MPDVQLYRRENDAPREQQQGLVRGRPVLVVEVVSTSSRRHDRVTKLRWHAQREVPEYWVVAPEEGTLEQLVLKDGAYMIAASLAGDEVFRPESFPELEVPLEKLWGERQPETALRFCHDK